MTDDMINDGNDAETLEISSIQLCWSFFLTKNSNTGDH